MLGFLASSYAAQIIGQYGFDQALARLGVTERSMQNVPMIRDEHRVWYNPNQKDAWFMPISELLTVITILSIILPAAAAVHEKERGTIEQLLVSPLTPVQILLPKVIAMTLVILLGTTVSLFLVLDLVFHIPIKGSLPLFFAVTALYTIGHLRARPLYRHHEPQSGSGRHARHPHPHAHDFSFRRLDPAGSHARRLAPGHVSVTALYTSSRWVTAFC